MCSCYTPGIAAISPAKVAMDNRRVACSPLAMSAVLLVTSSAFAADVGPETEAKVKLARTACLAGDADKGAALLAELFVETKDFNHIYNQGRCFEQNHRYEDALSRFREYLRKAPALSAEERRDAEAHVDECERLAGIKPLQQASPAPAETLAAARPEESPPPVTATVVQPAETASDAGSRRRTLRIAGIASGAVGLASLGAGIYYYARAVSLSDDVSNSDTPSVADDEAGKNAETMQWVFYSIGGAAVAAGAVLYYLGWRDSAGDDPNVAIVPMAGPGLAGISAQGAF